MTPAAGVRAAGVVLACVTITVTPGCAGQRDQLQDAMHAARDLSVIAKPCLVAAQDVAEERCAGDEKCIEGVREGFEPAAKAIELIRTVWCAMAEPGSEAAEGCK